MTKGNVLRIYDSKSVIENLDISSTSSTQPSGLILTQNKDTGIKSIEKFNKLSSPLSELGQPNQIINFKVIFGFYELLSGSYIALVVDNEEIFSNTVLNIVINKVKKIIFLPLFSSLRSLSKNKQEDEENYLKLLQLGLTQHDFYYSLNYDITLTQQRIAKLPDRISSNSSSKSSSSVDNSSSFPLWSRADDRFFWNRELVDDLIFSQAHDWIVPFMSGTVQYQPNVSIVPMNFLSKIEQDSFTLTSSNEDYKKETNIDFLLISRRSKFRQGTRFIKRGIDENGNVGNFVETEQIVLFKELKKLTSFVQIRGSIPLKWSSVVHMKYEPEVFLEMNQEYYSLSETKKKKKTKGGATSPPSVPTGLTSTCVSPAILHFKEVLDKYCDNNGQNMIILVNLIDKKKAQGKLGEKFEELVEIIKKNYYNQLNSLHNPPTLLQFPSSDTSSNPVSSSGSTSASLLEYIWYDFHSEIKKKNKYQNLISLLEKIKNNLLTVNYFSKSYQGHILSWQAGIIRTNCMDNLDRTNVIQSLFGKFSFLLQLNLHKIYGKYSESSPASATSNSNLINSDLLSYLLHTKKLFKTNNSNFETAFNSLWINNANVISYLYAGTNALKIDMTLRGKMTLTGLINDGINSMKRFYLNNFYDGLKQDSIDLLLGNYRPRHDKASPFLRYSPSSTIISTFYSIISSSSSIISSLFLLILSFFLLFKSYSSIFLLIFSIFLLFSSIFSSFSSYSSLSYYYINNNLFKFIYFLLFYIYTLINFLSHSYSILKFFLSSSPSSSLLPTSATSISSINTSLSSLSSLSSSLIPTYSPSQYSFFSFFSSPASSPSTLSLQNLLELISENQNYYSTNRFAYYSLLVYHLHLIYFFSLFVVLLFMTYFLVKLMKKGHKLGNKLVIRPLLCPEPLPTDRI